MKKSAKVLGILYCLVGAVGAAEPQMSMSEADKALYATGENPGDLYISKGEEHFNKTIGAKNLAVWLGVDAKALAKELASYPKYLKNIGAVVSIDQMLQAYMIEKGMKPLTLASSEMVEMSSFVKSMANGEKVSVDTEGPHAKAYYILGDELYHERRGGRGLSCDSCHSAGVLGLRLRMQELPNLSAPNIKSGATWPAYRMTKSELTTMQKRFQGCMDNSLQTKLPLGSKEMVALELYVTSMANGQEMAIPGLKR